MLWYGVCAGLHPQSSVLSEFGGLGRRLLRDVLRREHILDRPDCDLAFDELQVLLRKPGSLQWARISGHGSTKVEIMPMVCTMLRVTESMPSQQPSLFDIGKSGHEFEQWLWEAKRLARELTVLFERGPSSVGQSSDHRKYKRGKRGN